ncbi:MAG: ATP-dependent DNA helicase RecG [Planctomycetota bacterium]|nr:ATP-dependent DNA helicase RecG [Planctomycetota bacterium]
MSSPRTPDDDVGTLPGIRAARRTAFEKMGVETLADLLRLAPRRYEDRRHPCPIEDLESETTVLVIGRVEASKAFRTRGGVSILEATVTDGTGSVHARWFYRGFCPRPLEKDRRVALYGAVKKSRTGRAELQAPELERLPADDEEPGPGVGRIVPVHPRTTGLSATLVRKAVWDALEAAAAVPDPIPAATRAQADLPALGDALRDLHFPDDLEAAERARVRLAFDELLVHELLLARRRTARQTQRAPTIAFAPRVHERIRARLPFTLTAGQEEAIGEIVADLERPAPMYRLLQGDVGSGKTAVAAYALLGAVAEGWQTVFMAPTDVLARQHQDTLETLLAGSRVRVERLSGRMRAAPRREALARIAAGEADIVIGTHAVLGEEVLFRSLGLVVVDEQHKFGVRQRRTLLAKGEGSGLEARRPHCLVMTATPIPRTLALTVWGDMDVSVVRGTIPGRTPVETLVVTPSEGRTVMERVKAELAAGHQAYVIYPLVEESGKLDLKDAHAGRDRWTKALPDHQVGLLHGRLARDAKEEVMQAFREGALDVLVATVVVEVGVDVPNATVLVVEHAERFGLSQLHQLRGRVGRGAAGGLCVLVDRSKGDDTPARLDVLAGDTDGFVIAEEDLKLRGVGDVFGTRQHGRPAFRAASLPRDLPILTRARAAARAIVAADPGLAAPAHGGLARAVTARLRHLDAQDRDAAQSAR